MEKIVTPRHKMTYLLYMHKKPVACYVSHMVRESNFHSLTTPTGVDISAKNHYTDPENDISFRYSGDEDVSKNIARLRKLFDLDDTQLHTGEHDGTTD